MRVAFWSNVGGSCSVTSNLACISVMNALSGQRKAILIENHLHPHNLQKILFQIPQALFAKDYTFYGQTGIDYFIRRLHAGLDVEKAVEDCAISVLPRLYYLPQSWQMNEDQFNYEFEQVFQPLLSLFDEQGYDVYFDVEENDSVSTQLILKEVDKVVVNLCQNPRIIEDFFERYAFLRSKAVYLFGNYNPEYVVTISKIVKRYSLKKDTVGLIPYSTAFANAMYQGKMAEFLEENIKEGRKSENKVFIEEVKQAAEMIGKQKNT